MPEGSTALLRHRRPWVEVVRGATHLVNNANFPHYFRKHPGQHYLQTWHGTPLKRSASITSAGHRILPGLREVARDTSRWDYLISQNPFSTEILRRAFKFEGRSSSTVIHATTS